MTENIQGPNVEFTGDASKLKKAAAEGDQAIGEFSKSAETKLGKIKTAGEKAFDSLMKRVDKLASDMKGSGATQKLHEIELAVQKLGGAGSLTGPQLQKLAADIKRLETAGGKVPASLAQIVRSMEGVSVGGKGAEKGLELLSNKAQGLAGSMGPLGSVVGALGPAGLAAAAGIGAVAGAVTVVAGSLIAAADKAIEYAGHLSDMSAATGISVESLQKLEYAGMLVGVSLETTNGAVFKLQRALENTPEAFDRIGLSASNLKTMAPEQQLAAVARAIGSIESPSERAAAAIGIFGKGAEALMPLLRSGFAEAADRASELGLVMSSQTVAALDATGDAADSLKATFEGLVRNIGASLVTSTDFAGALSELATILGDVSRVVQDNPEMFSGWLPSRDDVKRYREFMSLTREYGENVADFYVGGGKDRRDRDIPDLTGKTPTAGAGVPDVKGPRADEQALEDAAIKKHIAGLKQAEAAGKVAAEAANKTRDAWAATVSEIARDQEKLNAHSDAWSQKEASINADAAKSVEKVEKAYKDAGGNISAAQRQSVLDALEANRTKALALNEEQRQAEMAAKQQIYLDELDKKATAERIARMKEVAAARDDIAQSHGWADFFAAPKEIQDQILAGTLTLKQNISNIKSALSDLPNVILGAIQGGGDVGKAIGASLGGAIGKDLAKSLGGTLGKTFGGVLGSAIPIVGTLLGSGVGGLFDKVFGGLFGGNKEKKQVNEMRQKFIESAGGLEELTKRAKEANVPLEKLFNAKKVKDYESAVKGVSDALDLHDRAMEDTQKAIDKYGFSIEELGPKWKQQKLDELAGGLMKDYELLVASGIDVGTVISKMGPAMQDYFAAAQAAGTGIPESMRPALQKMLELGLLTDAAGSKLTSLDGVNFTQSLSEGLRSVVEEIRALIVALGGVPTHLPAIDIPLSQVPIPREGVNGTPPSPYDIPTHALGTRRTAGGLARLHPNEAVLPAYANPWAGGDFSKMLGFPVPNAGGRVTDASAGAGVGVGMGGGGDVHLAVGGITVNVPPGSSKQDAIDIVTTVLERNLSPRLQTAVRKASGRG